MVACHGAHFDDAEPSCLSLCCRSVQARRWMWSSSQAPHKLTCLTFPQGAGCRPRDRRIAARRCTDRQERSVLRVPVPGAWLRAEQAARNAERNMPETTSLRLTFSDSGTGTKCRHMSTTKHVEMPESLQGLDE